MARNSASVGLIAELAGGGAVAQIVLFEFLRGQQCGEVDALLLVQQGQLGPIVGQPHAVGLGIDWAAHLTVVGKNTLELIDFFRGEIAEPTGQGGAHHIVGRRGIGAQQLFHQVSLFATQCPEGRCDLGIERSEPLVFPKGRLVLLGGQLLAAGREPLADLGGDDRADNRGWEARGAQASDQRRQIVAGPEEAPNLCFGA